MISNEHALVSIKCFETILFKKMKELSRMDISTDQGDYRSCLNFIIICKTKYRLNHIANISVFIDMWADVRADDTVLDFVLETVTELVAKIPCDINGLIRWVADSYGCFTAESSGVLDIDTLQRFTQPNELNSFLKENKWAIFFFMVQLSDINPLLGKT